MIFIRATRSSLLYQGGSEQGFPVGDPRPPPPRCIYFYYTGHRDPASSQHLLLCNPVIRSGNRQNRSSMTAEFAASCSECGYGVQSSLASVTAPVIQVKLTIDRNRRRFLHPNTSRYLLRKPKGTIGPI